MTSLNGHYVPSPTEWVRDQVAEYEVSEGTRMNADPDGRLIVILTSRGARSGSTRKNPVMRVEADGTYAVVASLAGAPENPQWFHNLVRHPRVALQDGADRHEYDSRLVTGDERALWWSRAVAAYPTYADYQVNTDREIPIFVMERAP